MEQPLPKLKLRSKRKRSPVRAEHAAPPEPVKIENEKFEDKSQQVIPAYEFTNGSLLETLSVQHLVGMVQHTKPPCWPAEISYGTLCSGSEVAGMCLQIFASAIKAQSKKLGLGPLVFKQRFACESQSKKQDHHFGRRAVSAVMSTRPTTC